MTALEGASQAPLWCYFFKDEETKAQGGKGLQSFTSVPITLGHVFSKIFNVKHSSDFHLSYSLAVQPWASKSLSI